MSKPLTPPTAEQLAAHLEENPPRPPGGPQMWMPLVPVAVFVMLGLLMGGLAAVILPWVAVLGLMVFISFRVRRAREAEARATRTQELAMLRRYPEALRAAWTLLPAVSFNPLLHARTVALLAHALDRVGAYEPSLVAYDYLLQHLPEDHPTTFPLRVQRALVALLSDHLVDADTALRRLRGTPADEPGTPVGAAYRFAQLVQHVRTNHFGDAIDGFPNLVEDLRPLSTDAGYGYGLMALCHHRLRRDAAGAGPARTEARRWWEWATLLLPPAALIDRFPELAAVADELQEPAP